MDEMMTEKQSEFISNLWNKLGKTVGTDPVMKMVYMEASFTFDSLTTKQASQLIDLLQRALDMEYLLSEVMDTPKMALFGDRCAKLVAYAIEAANEISGDDQQKVVDEAYKRLRTSPFKKYLAK